MSETQNLAESQEDGAEHGHCFHIGPRRAPHVFGESDLTKAVDAHYHLSHNHNARGKLADPQQQGYGKLSDYSQADNKLTKAKQDSYSELGHGYEPHGKLTHRNDTLGNP